MCSWEAPMQDNISIVSLWETSAQHLSLSAKPDLQNTAQGKILNVRKSIRRVIRSIQGNATPRDTDWSQAEQKPSNCLNLMLAGFTKICIISNHRVVDKIKYQTMKPKTNFATGVIINTWSELWCQFGHFQYSTHKGEKTHFQTSLNKG